LIAYQTVSYLIVKAKRSFQNDQQINIAFWVGISSCMGAKEHDFDQPFPIKPFETLKRLLKRFMCAIR
jgi:hypothetical protein